MAIIPLKFLKMLVCPECTWVMTLTDPFQQIPKVCPECMTEEEKAESDRVNRLLDEGRENAQKLADTFHYKPRGKY